MEQWSNLCDGAAWSSEKATVVKAECRITAKFHFNSKPASWRMAERPYIEAWSVEALCQPWLELQKRQDRDSPNASERFRFRKF